jgi:hypothetical protein
MPGGGCIIVLGNMSRLLVAPNQLSFKPFHTAGNGDTLGFVARFFDRNCVGTLERDDIEDIAFMTAPPISRAYS